MDAAELNPQELNSEELATRLRAAADGMFAAEASVELIVRSVLLPKLVRFIELDAGGEVAAVDWFAVYDALEAGTFGLSRGEQHLMDIAASLGAGHEVNLNDLAAMDEANAMLVLQAIVHSLGWHLREQPAVITGTFG